jgi:hypothetical protein
VDGDGVATLGIDRDPDKDRDDGHRDGQLGAGRDGAETGPGNRPDGRSHDRLGRELWEVAAATLQLAVEMRPMLDNDAAAALENHLQEGRCDACRIAVIGQVKAGKSTLINALIRRPGFLPADVNPWTAVVTNLHFGRPSDAGAVYQFLTTSTGSIWLPAGGCSSSASVSA